MAIYQYKATRGEIDKSIFVQYDVIKTGTLFLGTLLVAAPAIYSIFGESKMLYLAATLVGIAYVSMSFVFIMGAGEIRIMRAAAFNNRILRSLECDDDMPHDDSLIWDEFVAEWNVALQGTNKAWKYEERFYLTMPFLVVAAAADAGAAAALLVWAREAIWSYAQIGAFCALALLVAGQALLYAWPTKLSRRIAKAYEECSGDAGSVIEA